MSSRIWIAALVGALLSLTVERLLTHRGVTTDATSPERQTTPTSGYPSGSSCDVVDRFTPGVVIGGTGPRVVHYSLPALGAQVYRRPKDDTTYYVEGDERHLVAIAPDGTILWREDPFTQAKLEPYRFERPRIARVGEPASWMVEARSGSYIAIQFDSTQFGIVDTATGEFIFLGQRLNGADLALRAPRAALGRAQASPSTTPCSLPS